MPRVDFISGVGSNAGGLLRHVVTDLCVMDFESPDGALRIRSLHPGVSVEQVRDNTGFDLHAAEHMPTTRGATPEELAWLEQTA